MNRRIVSSTSASIIFFLLTSLNKPAAEVALGFPTTTIFVDPPTGTAEVGQAFFVNIRITDVADLYCWEFKLGWDPSILDAIKVSEENFLKQGGDTFFAKKINNTQGYVLVDCTLFGDVAGVNGSGTLASIEFYAEAQGESVLDLYDTILINSLEQSITHTANNGFFVIPDIPQIIILPLFMALTMLAIIFAKKRSPRNKRRNYH